MRPKQYHRKKIFLGADNFLSVLEGAEGGFAIFAGIVVGLSFEDVSRSLLILTAAISLIVNAFNAAAVRYMSEHYLDEIDGHEKRHWFKAYFWPSLIEFLVYGLVSLISILPLIAIADKQFAITIMVALTLLFLFITGWLRGVATYGRTWRDAIETLFSGSLIIFIGGISGYLLSQFII